MTDHEPGNNPDKDPIGHLDFDIPEQAIDSEGNSWLPINFDEERRRLIDGFFDHLKNLTMLYGEIDTSNDVAFRAHVANLERLIAKDEAQMNLYKDNRIQLTGVAYMVHDGEAYIIREGDIVRGRYQGIALYPFYTQIDEGVNEALPIGLNVVLTEISIVSDNGEIETEYELPEGDHVLFTLHGLDVRLHKLEPIITT